MNVNILNSVSGAPPSIGAFDLDLAYNSGILSPTGVVFGPFLGDLGLFEAVANSDLSTPGIVDFAELSFLTPFALDNLQPADFTLATVSFNAIGNGTSSFDLVGDIRVSDAFGNQLIKVSEPASLLLERIRASRAVDSTLKNSRARKQKESGQHGIGTGPRMPTDSERDFLRREKAAAMRILRARRKVM